MSRSKISQRTTVAELAAIVSEALTNAGLEAVLSVLHRVSLSTARSGNEPVKTWYKLKTPAGVIQIFTPTQSVMDRLAGYYAWNDRQNLDQAVMVAKRHRVHFPYTVRLKDIFAVEKPRVNREVCNEACRKDHSPAPFPFWV